MSFSVVILGRQIFGISRLHSDNHDFDDCSDVGTHTIDYKVIDTKPDPDTESLCTVNITVAPPSPIGFTVGNQTGATGSTILVPVTINNFIGISYFQFSIQSMNTSIAEVTGIAPEAPFDVDQFFDSQIVNSGAATVTWFGTAPVTMVNGEAIFYVELSLVGNPGEMTNIEINSSQTPVLIGQDCPTPSNPLYDLNSGQAIVNDQVYITSVSGQIARETGSGVGFVTVEMNVTDPSGVVLSNDTTITDASGNYSFGSVLSGSTVTITPKSVMSGQYTGSLAEYDFWTNTDRSVNPPNQGASIQDAAIIAGQLSNWASTSFSPYQMIAANVANTGGSCSGGFQTYVNFADLGNLQAVILVNDNDFQNNESWRFVPSDYVFPDPHCPWVPTFPESVVFTAGITNASGINFNAIKTGDVNNNGPNYNFNEADDRSGKTLIFSIDDIVMGQNEEYIIPVKAKDFSDIIAFQYSIEFDSKSLEILDFEEGELPNLTESAFGKKRISEGILNLAWFNSSAISIDNETHLFSLRVRAKKDFSSLDGLLTISSREVIAEAYRNSGDIMHVDLIYTSQNEIADKFELYQNKPNPFKNETSIGFVLPEASHASLIVYDISGKVVKQIESEFDKGYNEILLDLNNVGNLGLLYYQVRTDNHTATKKMLIQK